MNDSYQEYLRSDAWHVIRDRVLNRDGRKCVRCGARTGLQAHHLTYVRLGREPLDDLVTLCDDCHDATHEQMRVEVVMRSGGRMTPVSRLLLPSLKEIMRGWASA